jgi:hypothetical protein
MDLDPDPGGPKTFGSGSRFGSVFGTLVKIMAGARFFSSFNSDELGFSFVLSGRNKAHPAVSANKGKYVRSTPV